MYNVISHCVSGLSDNSLQLHILPFIAVKVELKFSSHEIFNDTSNKPILLYITVKVKNGKNREDFH